MQLPADIVIRLLNKQSDLAKIKAEYCKLGTFDLEGKLIPWDRYQQVRLENEIEQLTGEINALKWVTENED